MNLIEKTFDVLHKRNKKALIPYIMAGDASAEMTVRLMHCLVEQGADILELGLPFSDPMADGPVIALAAERALAGGTNTLNVFEIVASFRATNQHTPIVLMGYLNPIEVIGVERFANEASRVGVNGLLIVDLPAESATPVRNILAAHAIDLIFLIAPTTTEQRMQRILDAATGYVYYVSLNGVTGSGALDPQQVAERVQLIKTKTTLPVGVGFGIRDYASAQAIGQVADGVIVGTAFVSLFTQYTQDALIQAVAQKAAELRKALDDLVIVEV